MTTKRFWVVMGPRGFSDNPYRHCSEQLAYTEAERLCRQYGGTFFVLEAKGAATRNDVTVAKFDDAGEIPF